MDGRCGGNLHGIRLAILFGFIHPPIDEPAYGHYLARGDGLVHECRAATESVKGLKSAATDSATR